MDETIDKLTEEIRFFIDEMDKVALVLSQKPPVSHKSNASIQWYGGIPGAIKDIRERNRLNKMINEPICDGYSFYSIAILMTSFVSCAVDKQIEIQKLLSPNDELYYGNVIAIYNSYNNLYHSWYNYSPDMAVAFFSEDGSNKTLVQTETKESFQKLDLPQELAFIKNNDKPSDPGCLGIFIAILFTSATLLGALGYGIYQFFV